MALVAQGDPDVTLKVLLAELPILAWPGVMLLLALGGIIVMIYSILTRKKYHSNVSEGLMAKKDVFKNLITNVGFILFILFCVYMFIDTYLIPIIQR